MVGKLRFDDAYGAVYELNKEESAYFFVGTYLAFGINVKMSDEKKTEIVINDPDMM